VHVKEIFAAGVPKQGAPRILHLQKNDAAEGLLQGQESFFKFFLTKCARYIIYFSDQHC
jgi:hypothetical protein